MDLPEEPGNESEGMQPGPKKPEPGHLNGDATNPDAPLFERSRLLEQSKDDLIDIIFDLRSELLAITKRLKEVTSTPFDAQAFGSQLDTDVTHFRPLPAGTGPSGEQRFAWRLTLISLTRDHPPVGFEIYEDVFIGRGVSGITLDLDLADFGGQFLGVSRQHALLRPAEDGLFLIDFDSVNGTYHNGQKLTPLKAQRLDENDVIAFGQLHFSIRLVKHFQEEPSVT